MYLLLELHDDALGAVVKLALGVLVLLLEALAEGRVRRRLPPVATVDLFGLMIGGGFDVMLTEWECWACARRRPVRQGHGAARAREARTRRLFACIHDDYARGRKEVGLVWRNGAAPRTLLSATTKGVRFRRRRLMDSIVCGSSLVMVMIIRRCGLG